MTMHHTVACCANLEKSFLKALSGEDGDVSLVSFPALCGRPCMTWEMLNPIFREHGFEPPGSSADVMASHVLFGSICLSRLAPAGPYTRVISFEHCFDMLVNRTLIDHLIRRHSYLVTPSWLGRWKHIMKDWGFTNDTARDFFRESAASIVLLDTLVDPASEERLEEFARWVNLPFSVMPVGLEHLQLLIRKNLNEVSCAAVSQNSRNERNESNRILSDYAAVMDVVHSITNVRTEREVQERVLELFRMLFAPHCLVYIPFSGGRRGEAIIRCDPPPEQGRIDALLAREGEGGLLESGQGFWLRFHIDNPGEQKEPVGVLAVDKVAFPGYLSHYFSLALNFSSVCSLAIQNARAYQQIVRTREEMREAREAADAANSAKSIFLASMSHELRTPMLSIIGMSGILNDTPLSEAQSEYVGIIRTAAESLLYIISDILDFSKMESGRFEIDHSEFNLVKVLDDVLDLMSVRAREKGLELICHIREEVPPVVIGDPGRLRQILINLLANAVKFTDKGEVTLRVSHEVSDDDVLSLRFEVHDTGIGIDEDRKGLLFQHFSQLGSDIARTYGGTGLGLAISKKLVEMMNGAIGVESVKGKGSMFWFTVVLKPSDWIHVYRTVPQVSLEGLRVLSVVRNAALRSVMTDTMEEWRCMVRDAEGIDAALSIVNEALDEKWTFDYALIEKEIWDNEEVDLSQALKALMPSLALVMISPDAGTGEAGEGTAADLCLRKPLKKARLRQILESGGGRAKVMTSRSAENSADERTFNILVAEDDEVSQKIARHVITKLGHQVTIAHDGREAIDARIGGAFDMILMDMHMPGMDGIEATRAIREWEKPRGMHIPIIATSASDTDIDVKLFYEAGMDDHIDKLVDADVLLSVIDRYGR